MASEFLMVPPGWTRANMKPTEMWCGVDTAAPGVMDVTSFGDQVRQFAAVDHTAPPATQTHHVPGAFFTSPATNSISITNTGYDTYWTNPTVTEPATPAKPGPYTVLPSGYEMTTIPPPAVRKIATDQDLGEAVQDALGFAGHSVKSIDLRVAAGEIVTATVEVHVHKEEAAKLAGIFSKQVKLKAVVTGERIVE